MILLLLLLLTLLSLYYGYNECPVSSGFNTELDSKYGYPIDIFDKKLYEQLISNNNSNKIINEYIYNCSSIEKENSIIHKCSTLTKCPITENDVMNSIERSKSWKSYHKLCLIREKLIEPNDKINLIILGGSLTVGSGTWGCCCSKSIDKKCFDYGKYSKSYFYKDSAAYCGSDSHELYGDVAKECSWPIYLYKWFISKSLGAINLINLAESGSTSMYKSERVIDQLKRKNITMLTESDIILIDHSVNDANSYNINNSGNKFSYDQWVNGLESLIRRLYFHSKQESFPTIIILEQYPYNSMRTPDYNKYDSNKNQPSYSNAYAYVAKKYSLPLWSYKDLVANLNDSLNYIEYLRFEQIPNDGLHPNWFIHLYFADLIASIFTLTFHECLIDDINNIKSHIKAKNEQYYGKLPSPYSLINVSYCSDSLPYLDISADMILYNRTSQIIGKYEYNGSWIVTDESKLRRSGFISSYMNKNQDEISILRFFLRDNFTSLLSSEKPSILKIHYMRTYKDAGVVDIIICKNYITTLDSLWNDYEHYKFTLNDIFTFDYVAYHTNYCLGYNNPSIDFIHRYYIPENTKFEYLDDKINQQEIDNRISKELIARSHQKFKLISIIFCNKEI